MTSDGENEDSNDDASVLRRDDDASCLAAMLTIVWQSDDLLQQCNNRRWHEWFDKQERRVEETDRQTNRQAVSEKEEWKEGQDERR